MEFDTEDPSLVFNIFATMKISLNHNQCIKNMSKKFLLSSYTIFHVYTQYTTQPTIPNKLNSDMITSNCAADYFEKCLFSITVFDLYESLKYMCNYILEANIDV